MNKTIIILIAALMVLTPMLAEAQEQDIPETPTDFTIAVDNPVVFLAADLTGGVTGLNGTVFSVVLVNMTSFQKFTIISGMFNATEQRNFTRRMGVDYYPAGRYTLNLTNEGETICHVQLTLVYNEKFVLSERIKDMVSELTAIWSQVMSLDNRVDYVEDNMNRVIITNFIIMIFCILVVWLVMYYVVLRVFKAVFAYWKERSAYNDRKMTGLDCDQVTWADMEHKLSPAKHRPNLNPVPAILISLGVSPALSDEAMMDIFADSGMGHVMSNELTWLEKRKLERQKNVRESEGGVIVEAEVDEKKPGWFSRHVYSRDKSEEKPEVSECWKCHKSIKSTDTFCGSCGASAEQIKICPKCGKDADGNNKFCKTCGVPLSSEPEEAELPDGDA